MAFSVMVGTPLGSCPKKKDWARPQYVIRAHMYLARQSHIHCTAAKPSLCPGAAAFRGTSFSRKNENPPSMHRIAMMMTSTLKDTPHRSRRAASPFPTTPENW